MLEGFSELKRNLLALSVGLRRVRIEPSPETRANNPSLRRRGDVDMCLLLVISVGRVSRTDRLRRPLTLQVRVPLAAYCEIR